MLQRLTFVLTAVATLSLSMGCASSWPSAKGVSDASFASGSRRVRTVDVLPMDLQVWTYPGARHDPQAVAAGLESMASTMVGAELAEHGYEVVATMNWDGSYDSGAGQLQAMAPYAVAATTLSLSTFGTAQSRSRSRMLTPHLPTRLGTATGSDATLYVGGWAYSGHDPGSSTGVKVAKGVLIGVLIVAVVAVVIAGAKSGGGSGGSGLGRAAGAVAKGVGRAAHGAIRATGGFGRVAGRLVTTTARGVMRAGITIGRHGPRIAVDTLDAWGRAGFDTHIHIQPTRIDYLAARSTPRRGRSAMLLEMTLIDNHSGQVLWHARKRYPASPRKAKHVHKAIRRLMGSLPEAGAYAGPPGLAAGPRVPARSVLQ